MGPERREIPKVEFFFIFLLLAMFRLVHFLVTPSKQYSFINSTTSTALNISVVLGNQTFRGYLHLFSTLESFLLFMLQHFVKLIEFCCLNSIILIKYTLLAMFQWIQCVIWWIYHSWEWWIVLILGLWNDPNMGDTFGGY